MAVAFACWGLAGGCGGRSVLDEPGADTGGSGSRVSSSGSSASSSGTGSSSGSGPIVDASMPDAGCDAQRLEAEVCQLVSPTSDPPEAHVFPRHEFLLDFFRQRALASDPALCGGGTTLITCAYDPTIPRSGPADIHHSNALGEFVGPDGDPWIWDYVQPRNLWIAVDENRSPATYALVVDYVTCFLEQDAGPGTQGPSSLCPQGTASCGAAESCLESLAESSPGCGGLPDWVFVFSREQDFIDYMQMVLQLDAAPVSLTEAQIVGPNGHPYVYGYIPSRNAWFVVDGYYAPAAYQLGVEYDQCTAPDAAAD
jgi:hypothetical protein